MKYFKIKLTALFIMVLLSMIAFSWVIGRADYFFTQLVLLFVIAVLIWQLFSLIDSTNRQLSKFLLSIKYHDYSLSFPESASNSFKGLQQGLNNSIQQLSALKEQESQNNSLFIHLLQRVPIGVMVVNQKEQIEVINESACDLLSVPALKEVSRLNEYHPDISSDLKAIEVEKQQKLILSDSTEIQVYKLKLKKEEEKEIYFIQSFAKLKGEIELQAWQRLINVLTHEVMNSITSISSLASSLSAEQLDGDLKIAAESIERRSKGLIQFTESYREVANVQAPKKEWFSFSALVNEQQQLLQEELSSISVEVSAKGEQQQFADPAQMAQVLINLFLNAKAALAETESPKIEIEIKQQHSFCILQFKDNGKGIPFKEQNNVFVPFYTSRRGGKGIGLSLCRQLMQNNGGMISLRKSEVGETIFELRLDTKKASG